MGLFTQKEKTEAWNRLKNGKSAPMDRILAHTMIVSGTNLAKFKELDETLYNKAKGVYRLVRRSLIKTTPQFKRISDEILKPKHTGLGG